MLCAVNSVIQVFLSEEDGRVGTIFWKKNSKVDCIREFAISIGVLSVECVAFFSTVVVAV